MERALFKQLNLRNFDLQLYSAQDGWFNLDGNYDDAYLTSQSNGEKLLLKEYVISIIDMRMWRTVKYSEIMRADSENRHLVHRNTEGQGKMRNACGQRGTGLI